MLADLAGSLAEEAAELGNALEAELWASQVEGTWRSRSLLEEATAAFADGLLKALERHGDDGARAALTALGAACSPPLGPRSAGAAKRLGKRGAAEPAWAGALGAASPTEAKLMHDEIFDDAVTVLVEFEHPDGAHVLGVLIDNNLGRLAKDFFVGASLEEIARLAADQETDHPIQLSPLGLDAAATQIAAAVQLTDEILDPPVADDYWSFRALIDARLRVLPQAGETPAVPEVSIEERERLVQAFRASDEGARFATDQEALDVVSLAIDFCADYVDGRPKRWSPVLVELFMADWLPGKVLADRALFERVPEVLPAWIRHTGRLRGLPLSAIEETAACVEEWTEALLENAGEEGASPAREFLAAAMEAGVDPSDPQALERFVSSWNQDLGFPGGGPSPTGPEDDPDDEAFLRAWEAVEQEAAGVVADALAPERGKPAPDDAASEAARTVRAAIQADAYPVSWVAQAAGLGSAPPDDDAELLPECAAATISPREETGLDLEEESMLLALEPADWAGTVIELARQGTGAPARPRDLVAAIDRCPEIGGATAGEDLGIVEAALSTAQLAWTGLGLVDHEDRLTEVGAWVLPRALTRAWGVDFDKAASQAHGPVR